MGFRRRMNHLSNLLILACLLRFSDHFPFAYGKSNGTQDPVTPINHDLYHTR